jgi:hypothetical protein
VLANHIIALSIDILPNVTHLTHSKACITLWLGKDNYVACCNTSVLIVKTRRIEPNGDFITQVVITNVFRVFFFFCCYMNLQEGLINISAPYSVPPRRTAFIATTEAMYVQRNVEARSPNNCCREKAIGITYSECVFVALLVQHAMRMRRIILSYVACLAPPYVSTLSHKCHEFQKKSS